MTCLVVLVVFSLCCCNSLLCLKFSKNINLDKISIILHFVLKFITMIKFMSGSHLPVGREGGE